MARDPLRKEEVRWFRCKEENFRFRGKVEYKRQRVKVPGGGYEYTPWVLNRDVDVQCPHDLWGRHHIELVEDEGA